MLLYDVSPVVAMLLRKTVCMIKDVELVRSYIGGPRQWWQSVGDNDNVYDLLRSVNSQQAAGILRLLGDPPIPT